MESSQSQLKPPLKKMHKKVTYESESSSSEEVESSVNEESKGEIVYVTTNLITVPLQNISDVLIESYSEKEILQLEQASEKEQRQFAFTSEPIDPKMILK